jgi:hypothetical protein
MFSKGDPKEKEQKNLHAWAAVGFGFKSSLTFYDFASNGSGKMT